jgi:GNAT superfamily N-acetyltransferase
MLRLLGPEARLGDRRNRWAHTEAEGRMEFVEVTVYYLEMLAPSQGSVPTPREGLSVLHVRSPAVPQYRSLYDAVGKDYHWLGRRRMSDEALAAVIGDPRNELHVLHVDGTPAGFAELDRRLPDEIELVQFGLVPAFIGRGLGRWFLRWTIGQAWSYTPKRFWLHTCSLDHPAALPNYLKAGFVLFRQEAIRREL